MTRFTRGQVDMLLTWTEETIALIEETLNDVGTQETSADDENSARAIFNALYEADALAFPEIPGGDA